MSTGEILYSVLLGVMLVFAADMFRLWAAWARRLDALLDRIRARVQYRRF